MHTTPVSLLERLRRPADQDAWQRFVKLYTPLLYHWARRAGLQPADAADLVQDVLTVLVQKLPEFTYDPRLGFRNWLRTVALNKWRDRCRRRAARPGEVGALPLEDVAAVEEAPVFADAEYRRQLVGRALELVRPEFRPATWQAFWEYQVVGRSPEEVAGELRVSVNAIYLAKSRILHRLRAELAGLLD